MTDTEKKLIKIGNIALQLILETNNQLQCAAGNDILSVILTGKTLAEHIYDGTYIKKED